MLRKRLVDTKSEEKAPVFHDPLGGRYLALRRFVLLSSILVAVWAALFVQTLLQPVSVGQQAGGVPVGAVQAAAPKAAQAPAMGAMQPEIAVERAAYDKNAGSHSDHGPAGKAEPDTCTSQPSFGLTAVAGMGHNTQKTVFAILPADDLNGYLSYKRNCEQIDVLVPEMFEIAPENFAFRPLEIDSEMVQTIEPILQDRSRRPVLLPIFALGYNASQRDFLAQLSQTEFRTRLVKQMVKAAKHLGAQGLCFDADIGPLPDAAQLAGLLKDMKKAFAKEGLVSCILAAEEGGVWRNKDIVAASELVIVKMFPAVWVGSKAGALAPDNRFAATVNEIQEHVGRAKLVMALGNYAVDWVSGQVLPKTLAVSDAIEQIGAAGATLEFEAPALNSSSRFTDDKGDSHQIWMLDAISAHNQIIDLLALGITNFAVGYLGLEDPDLWAVLDAAQPSDAAAALRQINLRNHISYEGTGPFYRWKQTAQAGMRQINQDPETGKITALNLTQMPRTTVMERYGETSPLRIALTFDDGPNESVTPAVLDVLKKAGVPATFFVVGNAALKSPALLRRMVDEGHLIGSHTFLHPHLERVQPWQINLELNATQKLIAGLTGRHTRLFRPPYIRGSGPMTAEESAVFSTLHDQGYVVAGSDIVPPDWSGLSADGIVDYTVDALENGHGNIILLHDGRGDGMHTVEALPTLIARLQADGYQIVSLADLLGISPAALMPIANTSSAAFNSLSFGTIATFLKAYAVLFWFFIIAGVLRAIVYLVLAHKRIPQYPLHARSQPTVSIIIPAFNEALVILNSVRNALAADYPDIQVIVVDDGSTDDTLRVLREAYGEHPKVKILTQPNQGKWKALNTAYEVIDTEIAICIDADTQIARDAVQHMVAPFANASIGAVAGTILVGNKCNLLTRLQALEYFSMQNIGRRAQEHINGIVVVPGALGAWRVEAVRDLGLLSNETLTEDTDLTMWMLRGGYRVAYADKATGYTEAPADVKSLLKQRLRWNVGILQSLWKHKSALIETRSLRLLSFIDLAFFGFVLPILAPLVDVMILLIIAKFIMSLFVGNLPDFSDTSSIILSGYIILPLVDLLTLLLAYRFDRREKLRLLWVVPFQNIFYRQILYISVLRAVFASLTGRLARWDKLKRFGLTDYRGKSLQ